VGEIPKKFYDFKDYIYQYQFKETTGKDRYKLMKKLQQQRDMHSLKCDFTLKLNVAKGFADVARIYFPHNLDFRGRVYPVPPHLNHIGADISRGLLEFADSKPIGMKAFRMK
jgi:DNA-directed RNA polymerase